MKKERIHNLKGNLIDGEISQDRREPQSLREKHSHKPEDNEVERNTQRICTTTLLKHSLRRLGWGWMPRLRQMKVSSRERTRLAVWRQPKRLRRGALAEHPS